MGIKSSGLTVTDQFAGCGGSSQGARGAAKKIKGLTVRMALNHWKLAIETHNTNFPDTDHDCTDISACNPKRYPSTNILITSPECTNQSGSNGKKKPTAQTDMFSNGIADPAAERSRATMWDVPRFTEYHKYELIIVENVIEARKWIMWDAWLLAMHSLGYNHKCCFINSMHFHPTPQSRDRMYVVFWKKGNKAPDLEYMPKAYCHKCGHDIESVQAWKNPAKKFGKYKTQYVYNCPAHNIEVTPYYYAAFNAIDWSDFGKRIGDRKKPLSPNTIRRIKFGLDKYENESLIINDQHSTGTGFRVKSTYDHIQTIPTASHFKLLMPFVTKGEYTKQKEGYVRSVGEALQTQTTRQTMALIMPQIVELNRTGKARSANQPISTITAGGIRQGLLMPFMVENKGQSNARKATEPISTITTKPHHGIVTTEAWNSFISYYNGKSQATHFTDPMGTVTTKDRLQLVNYNKPKIEDCYYRMIKPHEIKLAMAFERDYIVLGSGKDQVKQCGNAVTPPVMEWLITQGAKTLL